MWSSFGWSKKRNFLEGLALSIGHFSEGLVWSDYLEKWKAAINCPTIVANTSKIGKFLVRIIFIPWDTFIICKVNKKPGQMYQKCVITYSAAVFFQGFTINLRFNPICSGVFFFWSCLPRGEGAAHSAPPCVNPDRKMLLTWNLAQAHTLSCYKKNGRKKFSKLQL